MKIVKPNRLSILTWPYRRHGADRLGVAVMAMASLADEPALLTEQAMWQMAAEEGNGALDLGVPKAVAEVLVDACAYTAWQDNPAACAVDMRVGDLEKSLLVFGDRYWLDGHISEPQPFESMRLDWSRAFGGPSFPANPHGAGADMEDIAGMRVRRLPNVESPLERIESPTQRPAPAGLTALPPDHPERLARLDGRYDERWLDDAFPGLPDEADWRFFNAAPADQLWEKLAALPPGMPYEFRHMHPGRAVLRGALPRWRARCFLRRRDAPDGLEEIDGPRLTTAWFFPHRERVILIWHGDAAIDEDDAADVAIVMAALETENVPRAAEHYRRILEKRLDPEHGVLHAMLDRDLAPAELFRGEDDIALPDVRERPMVRRIREGERRQREALRAEAVARGMDPDAIVPPEEPWPDPPTLDTLPERIEELERRQAQVRKDLDAERSRMLADPDVVDFSRHGGMPLDSLVNADASPGRLDPIQQERDLRAAGRALPGDADAGWIDEHRPRIREAYRQGVHLFDRAPAMTPLRARRARRKAETAMRQSRNLDGANFIGADLSGMDLSGSSLRGALMESADLRGARLDGCDLTKAVLTGACLDGASLAGARLGEANLAQIRCEGGDWRDADLSEADLRQARLSRCDLSRARLVRTNMEDAHVSHCSAPQAVLQELTAYRVRIEDCDFGKASLSQCMAIESQLRRVRFREASLERTSFLNTVAEALDFSSARITASSFVGETSLDGTVFARAVMSQCGLRGVSLRGADLEGVRLENCDLSECDLREARLDGAAAPDTLFVRADLGGASLRRAVLIDANLSKAVLDDADLSQANLFRADISQVSVTPGTLTADAYTSGAKVWPRRQQVRA